MGATIHEVAKAAGVSPRTVSNVVNDFVHVRPETRERVQRAIDELGYRPNISARRLRQGRTRMLGFAVPELSQPYFSELSELVENAARARGYTVIATQTGGLKERELQLLREFDSHMVDGLIFSPMTIQREDLLAHAPHVPTVLIGEQIAGGGYVNLAIDNVAAVRAVTAHLLAQGHTRIATLGAYHSGRYRSSRLRLQGYREALDAAGQPFEEDLVLYTDQFGRAAGRAGVHDALDRGIRFDALVCFTDVLALGAMRALADRGLRVPDDVAVTGIDDIEESEYCVPSLTTVAPDKESIAGGAVETVLSLIDAPDGAYPAGERDGESTAVGYRLVERESSRR